MTMSLERVELPQHPQEDTRLRYSRRFTFCSD